jgi:hypothetical protein
MATERLQPAAESSDVIPWLLEGDAAIRWQVMRDLTGASAQAVARERRKVAREGWGARLLAEQDPDGRWAAGKSSDSGMYAPKWISTTYTMLLLRDLGLPAGNSQARKACPLLLDKGIHKDGGICFDWSSSETCVTGIVLSILAHFQCDDDRLDLLADYLLQEQMPDGGWNCRRRYGATHSSVHTTILALEALDLYETECGLKIQQVRSAQRRGREFLLLHRLFRSDRTGAVIKPIFLKFSFPTRWHYDVLRGLDYFRAVAAPRDERLADAIDVVRKAQTDDGRWTLHNTYRGKTYFDMERVGAPSRWNTLRALRVLQWWDAGR